MNRNYEEAKAYLIKIFKEKNFEGYARLGIKGRHKLEELLHTCANGTLISIVFPGIKTKIKPHKIDCDYRVDLQRKGEERFSLSHDNIIYDIYYKIIQGGMSAEKLSHLLIELAKNGIVDLEHIRKELVYDKTKCSSNDLDLEELFVSIKWIVIQEDINYPITKGYQGRTMSFRRYVEAAFVTQNTTYNIQEVIKRANKKRFCPEDWDNIMDYSAFKAIQK